MSEAQKLAEINQQKKVNPKKEAEEILKGVQQKWAQVMHKVKRMNGRVLFNDKG